MLEDPPFAVSITKLSKRFGSNSALRDISLQLSPGHCHALLGPNASGKTTLLRIMAGLLRPDAGTVRSMGVDVIHALSEHQSRVGYLPQRFCYYDELTTLENLVFVARMHGIDKPATAADVAIRDFDLDGAADRRAQVLSGGQRQRLMLAAALMHRPALLLLDEPTTALDAASRDALWNRLHTLTATGITCILTTHEAEDAARCDTRTRLIDGSIVTNPATISA